MTTDPRDNLDWDTALELVLQGLPLVEEGLLRLYRIEPGLKVPKAEWLEQSLASSDRGQGRWFTEDPTALIFYVRDQALAQPQLLFLDVPVEKAHAWRVTQWEAQVTGEDPKRFSRDPETEYFLPSLDLRPDSQIAITPSMKLSLRRRPSP